MKEEERKLLTYYEKELFYIRKSAQEFAQRYPTVAARLLVEQNRAADPHVERLIEAFALLAGRIHMRLDDDFPELTDALLAVLYPHYLAPVPSFCIVQFVPDPTRVPPTGQTLPAGRMLKTRPVEGVPCRYRTGYPVTLWPLEVAEARLQPPPYPGGLKPPPRALAALKLTLRASGEVPLDQLQLDRLRVYLDGDPTLTAPLYDLLMNHLLALGIRATDRPEAPAVSLPLDAVRPVGFDLDEGLLPYPAQAFPGYRLLSEFFAYPQKFLFVDIWFGNVLAQLGPTRQVELYLFCNRTHNRLEQTLDASMLALGCTPALNLFSHIAEPIPLTHARAEHQVLPDVGHPYAYEVYSIDQVTAATASGKDREFQPFYSFRHGAERNGQEAFWYASRRPSVRKKGEDALQARIDHGTDVYLTLVDRGFDPTRPAESTLVVKTTCTNRDLPMRLPRIGEEVYLEADFAAGGAQVRCRLNPTPSNRPPVRKGRYWRLISHLTLNHLSLGDPGEGAEAVRELLSLYDFSDPDVDPQGAAAAREAIQGITDLSSRQVVAWHHGGVCRGLEVATEFDESMFTRSSIVLFASVLERFFALYTSVNSFTQMVARLRQREGELKRWPPRTGEQPLL